MSPMTYKGYEAWVGLDDGGGVFYGRLVGIRDVVSFEAETVAGLRAAFEEAVDDYLAGCREFGKEPDRPGSGSVPVSFRVNPEVHVAAAAAADRAGLSLDEWAARVLGAAAGAAEPA